LSAVPGGRQVRSRKPVTVEGLIGERIFVPLRLEGKRRKPRKISAGLAACFLSTLFAGCEEPLVRPTSNKTEAHGKDLASASNGVQGIVVQRQLKSTSRIFAS